MRILKLLLLLFVIFLMGAKVVQAEQPTCVYFFYGSSCPHCAKTSSYIETLEAKYALEVHRFNINEKIELVNGLYASYDVLDSERGYVPILFIGDKYLLGDTPIIENLESEIKICGEIGCECPKSSKSENSKKQISLSYILGLAAVDAINPCELAVLIILLTAILTKFPKEKNKALKLGLSFSSAIFIMYLIFGLLIISGFKFLTGITEAGGLWFFKLLGVFAIVLGILNIKDAIWYGGGGFIMEVPMKWRPRMKQIIQGVNSVKGAFVVGLLISFFLTPCTAGPYFVAGGVLSTISLFNAIPYLFLYMIVFISPMVIITLIVYFGFMTVENIGGWREKNIKGLHWLAGLILLGLGLAMVLGFI